MLKIKRMKKEKLVFFGKLLDRQRGEISSEIRHLGDGALNKTLRESSGDLSSHTLHMADLATDNYDRDFSLSLVSTEQKVLNKIDEALKRIEDKTYGYCIKCGKKLPEKRLKAMPYAELCIKHQEEEENINK